MSVTTDFSTVSSEEMAEILANYKKTHKVTIPEGVKIRPLEPELCKHAEDTGEVAFLRAPCRGNKIICHKIDGHVSFMKVCNAKYCKYFEEKRRSKSQ